MIVALIDNGSLEPAAHRGLRTLAAALGRATDTVVHAVSWKHSDRIPAAALDGTPAWTLATFVRQMHALGQRDFLFVPLFLSAQGAIGSALRRDLEKLRADLGDFEAHFADGLAARGVLPAILADRVRETLHATGLVRPPVVLVDHGGPSTASAALRDRLGADLRALLGREIGPLAVASMEGDHPPLLADQLRASALAGRDVIVALLFLLPGRHAGPGGDIAQICADAAAAPDIVPGADAGAHAAGPRPHLTDLIAHHPLALEALTAALRAALRPVHVPLSA